MKNLYLSLAVVNCFANDNDALIPEIWANESLMILESNAQMANLVHRDFENEVKDFGDVVNTRRPGNFKKKRKNDSTTLTQQDAVVTNVAVPLDQWFYSSFIIKDGERSKSMKDLFATHLEPAVITIKDSVDCALLGRIHQFLAAGPTKRTGRLQNLTGDNAEGYLLEAKQILTENKAPQDGRRLMMAPSAEAAMLKTGNFVRADQRGDGGRTLATGQLGHVYGFDTFVGQNVNNALQVAADVDTTLTVTNALAAGGSGSQVTAGLTGAVVTGEYLVVAGNDQPTYITAHTESSGDTVAVTLHEANKYATLAAARTIRYKSCAVDGAFAAGTTTEIRVDGYTTGKAPQIGQLISFGTGGSRRTYTVIESTDNGANADILLDRPLELSLSNNDVAFPGPAGSFNWAFHKEAIALVTRPLALPSGEGVKSGIASYNGLSIRVLMQYDINSGGTVVNLDMLAGIAMLDAKLCIPMLG